MHRWRLEAFEHGSHRCRRLGQGVRSNSSPREGCGMRLGRTLRIGRLRCQCVIVHAHLVVEIARVPVRIAPSSYAIALDILLNTSSCFGVAGNEWQ